MGLFITDNGEIMPETDGEFTRIKKPAIGTLASGDKIENGGMEDRAH